MKTTQRSETAARYLRGAESQINTYGEDSAEAMLTAEVYGLLAYREGNIEEIIAKLRANYAQPTGDAERA